MVRADVGVYVHIPFCATRCDYCAFATWTDRARLIDDYLDACVADVVRQRADCRLTEAATVYFGGGTPSLVPADGLVRILDAIPRAADAEATLDDVLAFDPPHVSVYGLMVEPGTPLERRITAGEIAAPDPDAQADRYLRADARLTARGLDWYEVSNWARAGHECRHNQGYWTGADCVAIGAAAHSHDAVTGTRTWNSR